MSIVSTTYTESAQADGGAFVDARMTDQDGNIYTWLFYAAAGYDIPARVTELEAQMNLQLAEDELRGFLEGGG
jgi:hypothetical protein